MILYRRYLCLLIVLACFRAQSQDLKQDWAKIQAEFLSGMHDSVVTHIRPFIMALEKQNLRPQLGVALFHYAVSLAQTGNSAMSDTAFERAKSVSLEAGLKDKVTEIEQKQAQVYIGLGKGMERSDPNGAVQFYSRAVTILSSHGNAEALASLYYQRGLLFRSKGDTARAVADFEKGMQGTRPEDQLRKSLVALLTELYLGTGQSEKARQLTAGTSAGNARVEYVIKLASDAEKGGDSKKAEELLASIQNEVLAGSDEARIFEFVKKRYSLAKKRGSKVSRDTLESIIRHAVSAPSSIQFRLHHLMTLSLVQAGDVAGAGERVRMLERLAAGSPDNQIRLAQVRGDVAYLQGEYQVAITAYTQAMKSPAAFDTETLLSISNNLGLALSKSGSDEEALAEFDRLAVNADRSRLPGFRIQADLNGGIVLIKSDRVKEATERLTRAKELADEQGDVNLSIMASLRLAESYRRDGYDQLADQMFEEVRKDQGLLANPMNRIQVLQALAANAKVRGNKYMALLNLRQAYDLTLQIGALGYQASLTVDLADTYFLVDSLESAKTMYRRALALYAGSGETGVIVEQHYKLGQCFLTTSEFDSARSEILEGLSLLVTKPTRQYATVPIEAVQDPDLFGQGLANLGFIDLIEGRRKNEIRRLLSSLEEVRRAVEVLERKKGIGVTQTQKESAQLRNVNAYRLLVDVSASLYEMTRDPQYFELAFNTSEKSRAEAFVTDVGAQLIAKINDPNVKELSEVAAQIVEERIQEQSPASIDLTSGQQSRGLSVKGSAGKGTDEKTLALYERIVKDLASKNNKAAQLVTVNTVNLQSVRNVLSPNDVLLSYYVSIDKLYLFTASKGEVALRSIHWTPEEITGKVEAFRSAVHDLKRTDFQLLGRELYDSLIAPVRTQLEGKRITVVPSGRLNNLPFACLMDGNRYLAELFDLTVLPNVSTIQFVRKDRKLPSAPKVIALGNPVNPRVTRLPGTEREVERVRSIYPGSVVLIGGQASETNSRNQMAGFDIIHIACHGLFNDNYPLLSSLVLSPDLQNDGFLEVHELYNMNLTNAGLVVLSACETGLSLIRKNDDVIGLVRGFLYAGVPSMVASLWKVDDDATASLMSNFHLLLKLGNSKGESLRKAQLQLLRSENTRHPYFWAAFVLYGSPD